MAGFALFVSDGLCEMKKKFIMNNNQNVNQKKNHTFYFQMEKNLVYTVNVFVINEMLHFEVTTSTNHINFYKDSNYC